MTTFDLFAMKLASPPAAGEYALAIYPFTGQSEPSTPPLSVRPYANIDQLCEYLNSLQFGTEPALMALRMALEGCLDRDGATFHVAQLSQDGARALGFQV